MGYIVAVAYLLLNGMEYMTGEEFSGWHNAEKRQPQKYRGVFLPPHT